jgi:hypothetical protein
MLLPPKQNSTPETQLSHSKATMSLFDPSREPQQLLPLSFERQVLKQSYRPVRLRQELNRYVEGHPSFYSPLDHQNSLLPLHD